MPRTQNSFEDRFFDQLQESFKDIKDDIKELNATAKVNTRHLEKLNGRLAKVETEVFPVRKETVSQLPPLWRDPQVLKIITILAVAIVFLLVIYAGLKGIKLPSL